MIEREINEDKTIRATLETIPGIPLIAIGDNVGDVLRGVIERNNLQLQYKDVIVIAQKIISKAEGMYVNLGDYTPSEQAIEMSQKTGIDPRLVELIIGESQEIKRVMSGTQDLPGIIVVKHKLGHMCSGAGVDTTNTGFKDKNLVLLLPRDPDSSAKKIADYFEEYSNVKIGVMIIDTLGDHYRHGSIGNAIGVANIPARLIEEGLSDLDGRQDLRSDIAFADSLAGLAMILMGNPNYGSPAVLIRGVDYPFTPSSKIKDVFEY